MSKRREDVLQISTKPNCTRPILRCVTLTHCLPKETPTPEAKLSTHYRVGQLPIREDMLSGVSSTPSGSSSTLRGPLELGVCGGLARDHVLNLNGSFCSKPLPSPTFSMLLKYCDRLALVNGGEIFQTHLDSLDLQLQCGILVRHNHGVRVQLQARQRPHVIDAALDGLLQCQGL